MASHAFHPCQRPKRAWREHRSFACGDDDMKTTITTDPSQRPGGFLKKNGASRPNNGAEDEIEIGGHRYLSPHGLARVLGISVRTLNRWQVRRIGPAVSKVGRLILYDLEKVPEWLASQETAPVRAQSRNGRRLP